jgi:glycosyltransferase involved in cell wall biosynthesis
MNFLQQTGVLILTYNEDPNIARTLDALAAFPEVVVLDSGSSDDTLNILARYPNTRLATRAFDTHAAQWNFGLTGCGLTREWVLALDADYRVSSDLVDEIAQLSPSNAVGGYRVSFRYCIHGHPLSGTLYPPAVALYRRKSAHYIQRGHTQRAIVQGEIQGLRGRIDHDDRKPLSRWLQAQQHYARLEADYLLCTPRRELRRADRLRLMGWPSPLLTFLYTLIGKGCIFDGWAGWFYVLQRTLAETMLALEIVDRRLREKGV